MLKAQMTRSILVSAMLASGLSACATVSVDRSAAGCSALIPDELKVAVPAPEFRGAGDVIGDWVAFADALAGKLDDANDHTSAAIGIVERCEKRDEAAVKRARRGLVARMLGM